MRSAAGGRRRGRSRRVGSSRTGPRSGVSSPASIRRWSSPGPPRRSSAGRTPARARRTGRPEARAPSPDAVRERERGCFGGLELLGPHRDDGNDVRGADARVHALVPSQVDSLARAGDPVDERLDELRLRSRDREDRSVMVGIDVDVEHVRVPPERVAERRDRLLRTALGEVRNGDERAGHERTVGGRGVPLDLDAPARQPALPRVRGGRVSARVAPGLRRERRPPRLPLRTGARRRRGCRAATLARTCGPHAARLAPDGRGHVLRDVLLRVGHALLSGPLAGGTR